jgi:hypothetical protein
VVDGVEAHELAQQQLQVRRALVRHRQECRQVLWFQPGWQQHGWKLLHPSSLGVLVRHVNGGRLREEARGLGAAPPRHAGSPGLQECVVHHRAYLPALLRLRAEQLVEGARPGGLQTGQVGRDVAAGLQEPGVVEAIGDLGEVDGAGARILALAQEVGRYRERAPDAAAGVGSGEALTQLEHRVDVALARVWQQEDMDDIANVLRVRRHG